MAFAGILAALLLGSRIPAVARVLAQPDTLARLALPHTLRVAGVLFLVVMALGKLPAVFALPVVWFKLPLALVATGAVPMAIALHIVSLRRLRAIRSLPRQDGHLLPWPAERHRTRDQGQSLMQQIINTEQAQAWNGYEGTHWADNHNRWNAVLSGINDARTAAHGHALGVDLSEPMLARARATATPSRRIPGGGPG